MPDREGLQKKLEEKRTRRRLYLDREAHMLSPDGVQSYGVGSRNATRYNTDLGNIRAAIDRLEEEITALEQMLEGRSVRLAQGVVPCDY